MPNRLQHARHLLAVTVVVASAFGLAGSGGAQSPPATWTLTPEIRIGSETAGPEYQFDVVRGVHLAPDGSAFVLDGADLIRQFDARGTYLRAIGRKGQGPGEYGRVSVMGVVGDTLYVADWLSLRVLRFSLDGRPLATTTSEGLMRTTPSGPMMAVITNLLPDGTALGFDASGSVPPPQIPYYRMTAAGVVTDTIAWLPTTHSYAAVSIDGRAAGMFPQPFADAPLAAAVPSLGRLVVIERTASTSAREGQFRVTAIGLKHDTIFSRAYTYAPKLLPSGIVDTMLAPYRTRFGTEPVRQVAYVPAYRAPVVAAFASPDGSLWLKREGGGPTREWTVVSPRGNLLATVTTPATTNLLSAAGDVVWGTELSTDDVPVVVRYRISRP